MIALAGLVISPISWTHHWVWLSLVPIFLWLEGNIWLGIVSYLVVWQLGSLNARGFMEQLDHNSPWLWHLSSAGYVLFSVALMVLFALFPRFGLRRSR